MLLITTFVNKKPSDQKSEGYIFCYAVNGYPDNL